MTTEIEAAEAATARRRVKMDHDHPRYKWVVLSNTTLGILMASINASIVLISLPAIFRGIGLNPLEPANVGYLLWMLMGYLVVTAVLVVPFGRLGDMFGRVRIYNLGFIVFTVAAIALSFDPFALGGGAERGIPLGSQALDGAVKRDDEELAVGRGHAVEDGRAVEAVAGGGLAVRLADQPQAATEAAREGIGLTLEVALDLRVVGQTEGAALVHHVRVPGDGQRVAGGDHGPDLDRRLVEVPGVPRGREVRGREGIAHLPVGGVGAALVRPAVHLLGGEPHAADVLFRHALVRREEVMLECWGTAVVGRSRSLDFFVGQIRSKLAGIPLHTVRGFGYRLDH